VLHWRLQSARRFGLVGIEFQFASRPHSAKAFKAKRSCCLVMSRLDYASMDQPNKGVFG
jgi:hypothetical protein